LVSSLKISSSGEWKISLARGLSILISRRTKKRIKKKGMLVKQWNSRVMNNASDIKIYSNIYKNIIYDTLAKEEANDAP